MKNTRLLFVTALAAVLFNAAVAQTSPDTATFQSLPSTFTDVNGKAVEKANPGNIKIDGHGLSKIPPESVLAGYLSPKPDTVLRSEDVKAGKINWVPSDAARLKELNDRVAQLTSAAQGLMQQRNALAQQALDAQLQLQQAQEQLAKAQQVTVAPAPVVPTK